MGEASLYVASIAFEYANVLANVLASTAFVLPKARLFVASPLKPLFGKERKTMRANTNKLNFYVSDEVRKKLEKLSKDSGLTMTAVITKLISEREIHPLKTDELLKIYNELNHIGNNINQIAHVANAERHISDSRIDSVVNLMNDVWRCVRSYK